MYPFIKYTILRQCFPLPPQGLIFFVFLTRDQVVNNSNALQLLKSLKSASLIASMLRGADGHRGEGQVGRWLGNVLWGGIRSSKTIEIRRSLTLSVVIVGFSRQLTTAMMDKYTERVKLNRK